LHRRFGLKHNTANQTLSEPAVLGFAQRFLKVLLYNRQKMTISKTLIVVLLVALLIVSVTRAAERPPVMGRNGAVSAGHPLTTAAAFEILTRGGNAFDAGVAALLAGGVVEQDLYSLGGEGLVLVYPRNEGKVTSVVGQGWAPKGATIEWYTSRGKTLDGEGLDP